MSRLAADEGRLVYVGNLNDDVRERDLGDMFDKYGKIIHIEIKVPPRPPNFAFIEYGDWRYVLDASSQSSREARCSAVTIPELPLNAFMF